MTIKFNAMPGACNTFVPSLPNKKKKFSEDEFVTEQNVPIMDEHPGEEEGLEDLDFTPEVLQQIIDRCNQRIQNTNDYPVLTIGHTGEGHEAPVVGFASNFKLGPFKNKDGKGVKAIYCDMHFKKDKYQMAKDYPRRSIELWDKDLTPDNIVLDKQPKRLPIDTISLLGGTRPARDLGPMFFKNGERKLRYELKQNFDAASVNTNRGPSKGKKMLDKSDIEQILEAVMSLPCMQWCNEQMNGAGQQEEQVPAEYAEQEPQPPVEPLEEEQMEDEQELSPENVAPEKLRMKYDQEKRRYAKLDSEYKTLFSKVAELERKGRRADRKAQLMQLEAEGFVFDMSDEVGMVEDMEPKRFAAHLSCIKKNYKKAPVGVQLRPVAVPEEGGSVEAQTKPYNPREVLAKAYAKVNDKISR